ncbi:MAG TPA: hypothetical protein VHN14_13125 [Kofleriaceae bacterium]|jgi:hypothetical protein|nr:hypothetical protein [Kofleriaceae bacterium]
MIAQHRPVARSLVLRAGRARHARLAWLGPAWLGLAWLGPAAPGFATPAVAQPHEAHALDFQGGLTLTQSVGDQLLFPGPGVLLELRGYGARHLWLSGTVAIEPALDLRDPEHGELSVLGGGGMSAGFFFDAGDRFTFLAGGRIDAVTASAWPGASGRVFGVRAGPTASAALMLGHAHGHRMALEVRVEWLHHDLNQGASPGRWQAGILLSGSLIPDLDAP